MIYSSGPPTGDDDVTSILDDLGCFQLCDIELEGAYTHLSNRRQTLIKVISGRSIDDHKFELFETKLSAIFSGYHTIRELFEGMGEALVNVRHHAYHQDIPLRFKCPGKRWWATACVDPRRSELRVFVLDQGVGIPATLPHSDAWQQVKTRLTAKAASLVAPSTGSSYEDVQLLKEAFDYARSRTGEAGRGLGFMNIMSAIDTYKVGLLRVLSGRAQVTYRGGGVIETTSLSRHIGGTIIEWALPLSVFSETEEVLA